MHRAGFEPERLRRHPGQFRIRPDAEDDGRRKALGGDLLLKEVIEFHEGGRLAIGGEDEQVTRLGEVAHQVVPLGGGEAQRGEAQEAGGGGHSSFPSQVQAQP
jgi:hypothetical protein